jgi:hypothetical protein
MAPEQAEGKPDIGPAADVWALGVILYRLLTGNLPFASPSLVELFNQICRAEPLPPELVAPGVPAELSAIVRDCLCKRPEERPTAGLMAERLEFFLEQAGAENGPPPLTTVDWSATGKRPRRHWWSRPRVLAALAGLAAAAAVLWVVWPPPKDRENEQPGKSRPVVEKPVRIKPIRVMRYETAGDEAVPRGRIGQKSFATRHGDAVTLTVELSDKAYFYLIAFNFDGQEQLLWPLDKEGRPSEQDAPPARQRLHYPDGTNRLYLDEKAKSGLQVYVVAASRQPLPSYAVWRARRQGIQWKQLPPGKTVWEADHAGAYAVVPGLGADRGSIREAAGAPPVRPLLERLREGGVQAVEAVAFPVLGKEGK